ncbi:hypothetical protein Ancab_001578 [Ancistrocladus abbreviatus]
MAIPKLRIALLTTLVFLTFISPIVPADENLIREECHQTDNPEVCIHCCNSKPNDTSSAVGIAATVVGCMEDPATILAGNMSNLASSTTNKTLAKVYRSCSKFFTEAEKNLSTVIDDIKNGDYDMAMLVLSEMGENYYETCEVKIESSTWKRSKENGNVVPVEVSYQMKIFDELGEDASDLIIRLD